MTIGAAEASLVESAAIEGQEAAHKRLAVVSMHAMYVADGVPIDSYLSRPVQSGRSWPGIVVGHSYRGLTPFYRAWSRQLAAEGFVVLVPDFYHGRVAADDEEASRLKVSLDFEVVAQQMGVAGEYLATLPTVEGGIGITGHCLGGGLALLALARSRAFAGAVIYYHSVYPDDADLRQIRCPVLAHFGTDDPFTPRSEGEQLERLLREAGQPVEVAWYQNVGHGFANRADPSSAQQAAADLAWQRTVAFFRQHLGRG